MNKLCLFAFVTLASGCAVDVDPIEEGPAASESDALVASVVVPVTKLSLSVAPFAGVRVFQSASEFRAVLRAEPYGIDFSREWAVFYSAGNNLMTSTPVVLATRNGDGTVLDVTGLARSPGQGCYSVVPSRVPYYVGKISRSGLSPRIPTIRYHYDRTITPCQGTVGLNRCSITGCPAGQICRVVDGIDGCMQAPYTCEMSVCPLPLVCNMQGDRATCVRPPVGVSEVPAPGFTVSFPEPSGTVSFPSGGIPSVCRSYYCGAGKACAVNFAGRPVCVSTTKPGPTY